MKKNIITLSLAAAVTTSFANTSIETKLSDLEKEIKTLKSQLVKSNKKLNKVKAHSAGDNIKLGVEFRNTFETLKYEDNFNNKTYENSSLLTSRLYLNMAAAPAKNLMFKGKLAIYNTWGSHVFADYSGTDKGLKSWSASSKATDTLMRIKEAYFVYKFKSGNQPMAFSIGRRPASNGFLANMRENEPNSGSPLAHITNMEVNGAMLKLNLNRFVEGSYTKFVLGRAHTGEGYGVYGKPEEFPFAQTDTDKEDENVDFFVVPGVAYNDGQYQVMYQWAHIFNTKGKKLISKEKSVDAVDAGEADLFSVGLKVDGIGDEINDFLDETTMFASLGFSKYNPKDGYALLSNEDGVSKSGNSIWVGAIMPDNITDNGKIGIEYNHGSKYWTPMTWAEDTSTGSKIAVKGDAFELYWNTNFFGSENLTSQIRYTHINHDYTPNINCAGWVASDDADITSKNLRFAITYKY
ncbi:MAG: DUF3373 family protein [Campylobacterota bacterium]|nr:DUF3373 family protein [Campylobacterota bacterium]